MVGTLITLTKLNLRDTQVSNLDQLMQLTLLDTLDVSNTRVNDVTDLERLPGLRRINISQTPVVQDKTKVKRMTRTLLPVQTSNKRNRVADWYDLKTWKIWIDHERTGRSRRDWFA